VALPDVMEWNDESSGRQIHANVAVSDGRNI
jgi:hypothetical protein